jgi:hypothetical protein
VNSQQLGEDDCRVVTLEGNEAWCLGEALAEVGLDSCTEWAEALG